MKDSFILLGHTIDIVSLVYGMGASLILFTLILALWKLIKRENKRFESDPEKIVIALRKANQDLISVNATLMELWKFFNMLSTKKKGGNS